MKGRKYLDHKGSGCAPAKMVRKSGQQEGDQKKGEPLLCIVVGPTHKLPEGIQLIHFPK